MDLLDYKFREKEIEELQLRRDNQPDARLKSRFIALLMLAQFLNHMDQYDDELKILMVEKFQIVKSKA